MCVPSRAAAHQRNGRRLRSTPHTVGLRECHRVRDIGGGRLAERSHRPGQVCPADERARRLSVPVSLCRLVAGPSAAR
jgi:hypothetical protein